MLRILEVQVDGVRCGIPLDRVVETTPRVRITPLPGVAPPVVGYVAYRGVAVPAVDLRQRLGQGGGAREVRLDEHLVMARARRASSGEKRVVALLVDRALGLAGIDPSEATPAPESALALAGVLALPDGLLLLADLDRLLSLEEERAVELALAGLQEP